LCRSLNGGAGNHLLFGGPNNDKFVFGHGFGNDTLNHSNKGSAVFGTAATERDAIDVHASDWEAVQQLISDDIVSGNAVVHHSATDSITPVGGHTADLHHFII